MELSKCPWCGAPYLYRENLEVHMRGCPRRQAAPPSSSQIDRYVLPVQLQREWIRRRESLWAEGRREYEWGAGLYLEDGRIQARDYVVGARPLELPVMNLRRELRPVGTVHYHPRGTGPDFDDWVEWVFLAARQVPEDLRPLFIVTLPDDTFHAYMYPLPATVRERWLEAWGQRDRIRMKVANWGEAPDHSASIDAHFGMVRRHEVRIWRRPRLGITEQYFAL